MCISVELYMNNRYAIIVQSIEKLLL
jgi:hypothetical protein